MSRFRLRGTSGVRRIAARGGAAAIVLCAIGAIAQTVAQTSGQSYGGSAATTGASSGTGEFYFVRLAYNSGRGGGGFGRRDAWLTDWPEAEQHLLGGIHRLTRIDAAREGHYLGVMDPELFDHPWLYAVEVGAWYLDDVQAGRLREYLLKGGFLMVDDFHGTRQWASFVDSMQRVFPDRPIVEVTEQDAVMHVLYDVDERTQVPGIGALMRGVTFEQDGVQPHWRGIYDDHGRLMVMINFNMDLGDAWEHADTPQYPEEYTALAYRIAINYALYAMTH